MRLQETAAMQALQQPAQPLTAAASARADVGPLAAGIVAFSRPPLAPHPINPTAVKACSPKTKPHSAWPGYVQSKLLTARAAMGLHGLVETVEVFRLLAVLDQAARFKSTLHNYLASPLSCICSVELVP